MNKNKHIDLILDSIDRGLVDCGVPEDSDVLRVIEEEVHAELDEERELGEITLEQEEQIFYNWYTRHHPNRQPITDDDPLASPIGYYEPPELITD